MAALLFTGATQAQAQPVGCLSRVYQFSAPFIDALGAACQPWKAPKRDGGHGSPCPGLTISAQQKRSTAMKKTAAIVGVAFTAGMLLTTAFAFSLLPLALT